MRKYMFLFFFTISCLGFKSSGQRVIGDCTITFQVSADAGSVDSNAIRNAYKKLYISGGKALTEISFNGFEQQTFYNENNSNVYILYQMSGEKYMRILTKDEWMQQYDNYKDAQTELLDGMQNILGYSCKQARITLRNGTKLNVLYTPELKTTVAENPYEFKNINGLVLKYEAVVQDKYRITYTASKVDFNPVPAEKFNIPKSGYRILNNTH